MNYLLTSCSKNNRRHEPNLWWLAHILALAPFWKSADGASTLVLYFSSWRCWMYISPVWKIQKMVKNPCLSVKNMRIWCEKFQKKFGLNWRFPWGAIAKTCSLAFCSAICPLHVIYKAICGPKKIHPVCLTFEPLRLQMTTIA